MNKRWFIGLSVLVVISLLLGGCREQPTVEEIVAKMKEVEASIEDAHVVLEVSFKGQEMDKELVVEVWEKKPNKFRAEVLEASDSELVGAISVTDGYQTWMYHPGATPIWEFSGLLFVGGDDQWGAMQACNELYDTVPELKAEFHKAGVELLTMTAMTPYVVLANKPLQGPDDFKGAKLRMTGPEAKWLTALGGTAVPMTFY